MKVRDVTPRFSTTACGTSAGGINKKELLI